MAKATTKWRIALMNRCTTTPVDCKFLRLQPAGQSLPAAKTYKLIEWARLADGQQQLHGLTLSVKIVQHSTNNSYRLYR